VAHTYDAWLRTAGSEAGSLRRSNHVGTCQHAIAGSVCAALRVAKHGESKAKEIPARVNEILENKCFEAIITCAQVILSR
jgi:hypothetical protein